MAVKHRSREAAHKMRAEMGRRDICIQKYDDDVFVGYAFRTPRVYMIQAAAHIRPLALFIAHIRHRQRITDNHIGICPCSLRLFLRKLRYGSRSAVGQQYPVDNVARLAA